jgi:hypothetical protein
MKIAIGLMAFLDPQPQTIANNSGPGRSTARVRPALPTAAGRVSRSRGERITDPALPTAVTPAGPAPAAEGKVVAAAAASTERLPGVNPKTEDSPPMISGIIKSPQHFLCIVFYLVYFS